MKMNTLVNQRFTDFILDVIVLDNKRMYPKITSLFKWLQQSSQLVRQDNYGSPSFEEDTIYQLLLDRDDDEYIAILSVFFKKIAYLEHHNINKIDMFLVKILK